MCKAAHHSDGIDLLNPRRWRGERLHHHGGGVCWLCVLLWMDSWRHELIVCTKWYKNNLKMRLTALLFDPRRHAPCPLGFIVSAISSSDVRNMFPRTAWICYNIAFACGFLTLVGLRFNIPYVSHRNWKWSLNTLPLLYIIYQQRGYLLNQVLYTRLLIWAELLSK